MLIIDIVFALLMALLLTALHLHGRRGKAGRWAVQLSFILGGIFAAWLAGVWLVPGDHVISSFYWVSYVLLFPIWFVLAIMLMVRVPSLRPREGKPAAEEARGGDAVAMLIFFSGMSLLFVALILARLL